ncbi:hypothetical protein [Photorhabdus luminescens]|uniref:Uncharacterized protein n=1 Tax=Photorhabdus luminescens subsp. sonorensis TaxID=1173677 RepID=A0A5C4RF79_PHOLU|nr:hypothetical protein [Photorhabdus luminescens]OWO82567.1 hypothetical protein B5C26_09315 [Photorhabdus luminescens]TNH42459.1 hypothetical protein EP164_16810 [Photorhabdus luminescens subsp. sonorensis]
MNILEQGKVAALYSAYSETEGSSWVGNLCCFSSDREHLPIIVNGRRFLIEFVIPDHLLDKTVKPRVFDLDINKQFLLRRDHREINIYLLGEGNFMDRTTTDKKLFELNEDSTLFIKTLRHALGKYVAINPSTTQFIFFAQGKYSEFIMNALKAVEDELSKRYRVRIISELQGPYYGFELDIISITA